MHYINDGIDTGDIVTQSFIAIRDDDNYASVLDRATFQCSEALLEALHLVHRNEVKVVKNNVSDKSVKKWPKWRHFGH